MKSVRYRFTHPELPNTQTNIVCVSAVHINWYEEEGGRRWTWFQNPLLPLLPLWAPFCILILPSIPPHTSILSFFVFLLGFSLHSCTRSNQTISINWLDQCPPAPPQMISLRFPLVLPRRLSHLSWREKDLARIYHCEACLMKPHSNLSLIFNQVPWSSWWWRRHLGLKWPAQDQESSR